MQYYQNGDYEKSAVLYKKLFDKSTNTNFYDPYFTSLLRLKKYDDAETLVKKLIKSHPETYMYTIDMGRILQERGQAEKANEWYNNLVRNLPKDEFAIRDLGSNFYRAEAYDFAIKTFMAGRKVLNNEKAFSFDLLALYRFRKDKAMLIYEYLDVIMDSPEIILNAQNVMSGVFEENADYELLKTAILRRLQKVPQNVGLAEMLTWQYVQLKDFDMALRQTIALDKRLKEEGDRVYDLSRLLISNQAYEQAIDALNYLVKKGSDGRFYILAKVEIIGAKSKLVTSGKYTKSDLVTLENDYKSLIQEFGKSQRTVFAMRKLANLQAFYLNKPTEAEKLLEELLQFGGLAPDVIGQSKLELGDIYILTGEVWEANLIYGQVEKQFANEPLGQEAKYRNAKLSYFQGDLTWAKAQLDVLKSSTSQLIANDALNLSLLIADNLQKETDTAALKMYAQTDLLIFNNNPDAALRKLDSIDVMHPGNSLGDDILMTRARIFIKKGDFNQAIIHLQQITAKFSNDLWGDDALFMLGDIFEHKLRQPDKAKELYEKIITDFPGSLHVIDARKRFRHLRGDKTS
ncbi:MAG TPA: tetratricopeptide repeat protein [Sphingobacteriaceae bacterium]|nr:tetratricopeptide repeat protein [Sphingobacteriaceae bacterium]